jgi:hypothetical protein
MSQHGIANSSAITSLVILLAIGVEVLLTFLVYLG